MFFIALRVIHDFAGQRFAFRVSQITKTRAASRTLFSYENLVSTAREFSRKCETLRCENSTLAIISLNYGMSMHNLSALTHKRHRRHHFVGGASKT